MPLALVLVRCHRAQGEGSGHVVWAGARLARLFFCVVRARDGLTTVGNCRAVPCCVVFWNSINSSSSSSSSSSRSFQWIFCAVEARHAEYLIHRAVFCTAAASAAAVAAVEVEVMR